MIAYMSSPAHIELMGEEPSTEVVKEAEPAAAVTISKKRAAQLRSKTVKVGGGVN